MSFRTPGIYVLKIQLGEPQTIEPGKLPAHRFEGEYLYVGSARGTGGLARVSRHLEIATGGRDGTHWHIDYLTRAGNVTETWVIPTEKDLECKLASKLSKFLDRPVRDFGSSDCDCYAHLFRYDKASREELITALNSLTANVGPVRFDWS